MPFIDELLQFKSDFFLETGTWRGDTIHRIANNDIYKPYKIISLELSDIFFNNCLDRFKNYKNIELFKANSKYDLYNIIKNIDSKITFWLDSHWSGIEHVGCDVETVCPILFELDQIKQHHLKNHIIMIDDIRLMDDNHFPVNLGNILEKIYEINKDYKVIYFDDWTSKNDILVAYIEEEKYCVHKYLTNCKTNPQAPGFGDYLRGTVALYNLSKKYNFKFYIDNQHPLFDFLDSNSKFIKNASDIEIIELLPPLSYDDIYNRLENFFMLGNSFSTMTNSFYTKENNQLNNYGKINNDCKDFLKEILKPSIEIENKIIYIFQNIYNIDLNEKFKIIHVRCGDKFIHNNNNYENDLYEKIHNKILNLIQQDSNEKYILMCDSSLLSNKLKKNINQIYYWDNFKIHLGDLINNNNNNSIFDTLVDFFIMSKSSEIISNGSGFSMIVSEIYDIKYTYL